MAVETVAGQLSPVLAIAVVGAIGVGSQWLAWRLRLPAIVLMLVAGVLIGPVLGVFDPSRDIGPLVRPMISVAVAIILFEGGLTLSFDRLSGAAKGVRRLVFWGAPLGWALSTLTLRYVAGLSWESAWVFGGIMIVTGPTVIAPLLRQARLAKRPAALLQWEAIVNDALGALAAVLAFEVVLVLNTATEPGQAVVVLSVGAVVAIVLGFAAGRGIAAAFRRGKVPEYMKVPVLFAVLLVVFALSDAVLHESGLLAVTIMGVVIANAGLPSYTEIRRFKEHATILLVSGVFILLAASLDVEAVRALNWRAVAFILAVVLVTRPLTVFLSLIGSGVPFKEQLLVALTGPRGVVLVAVAGLFGERLAGLGITDGAQVGPLAFVLVASTVVVHGFTLAPFARFLGLTGGDVPGVIVVGASPWGAGLAEALKTAKLPVLIADPNAGQIWRARMAGLPTFSGDILSEAAEENLELVSFATIVATTDNDAYNTLVATDLAPEFGRDNVFQVAREKREGARFQLPASLGGRPIAAGRTLSELNGMMAEGWTFRLTRLTGEFGFADWQERRPDALLLARIAKDGSIRFVKEDASIKDEPDVRLLSMLPPGAIPESQPVEDDTTGASEASR